jgi:threonylcarbamoyladenosine tRNA methylthiotransferase MtaB
VVLCGVNLGLWGRDLAPRARLSELVAALEEEAPVERIRLSSLEPWTVDGGLCDAVRRGGRIAPHLHLPVQSGDDEVLRRMGRPYRARDVKELVLDLTRDRDDIAVGVDLIAGFPGESEGAFGRTLELVRSLPIAYVHAFAYSARPGTRAASMSGHLDRGELRRRVGVLRGLGGAKRRAFARGLVGRVLHPLVEPLRPRAAGRRGVSESFVTLWLPPDAGGDGAIVPARAERLLPDGSLAAIPIRSVEP